MTKHVDYHSWCPAREGCTRDRCGRCPIVRSRSFRRQYYDHLAKLEGEDLKRELYREKRRQGVVKFRQSIVPVPPLKQTEQAIIAAHPNLYADNIGPKTDAADKADPIPRWIAKMRRPYHYEGGNGSSLGSRTVW